MRIVYLGVLSAAGAGGAGGAYWIMDTLSSGATIPNFYSSKVFWQSYGQTPRLLLKTDVLGNIEAQKQLPDGFSSYAIKNDSSGNVILAGETSLFGSGNNDGAYLQFDNDVNQTLGRALGVSTSGFNEFFTDVAIDTNGDRYFTGAVYNSSTDYDILTAKYNSAGTLQWQRRIGIVTSNSYQNGQSICLDSSSNVYVLASGTNATTNYLVKYNSSGTLQFQRQLSSGFSSSWKLIANGNDIYATSGNSIIIKFDTSGVIQWQRSFSNGTYGQAGTIHNIFIDSTGLIHLTQRIESGGSGFFWYCFNSSGTLQFQRQVIAPVSSNYASISGDTNSVYVGTSGFSYRLPITGAGTGTYPHPNPISTATISYAAGGSTIGTPAVTMSTPTMATATPSLTSNSGTVTITTPTVSPVYTRFIGA